MWIPPIALCSCCFSGFVSESPTGMEVAELWSCLPQCVMGSGARSVQVLGAQGGPEMWLLAGLGG